MKNKTLIVLSCISTLLSIVSCKKDDPNNSVPSTDIIAENTLKLIGLWDLSSVINENCIDSEDNDILTFECEIEDGIEVCLDGTITFSDNNTLYLEYTLTQDGAIIESESDNGTWEILSEDNILLVYGGDSSNTSYILTDNTLNMVSANDDEFGCTESINAIR